MKDAAGGGGVRLRKRRAWLAWTLLAAVAASLALGWLTPITVSDSAAVRVLVWVAFMVRTFTFHAGFAVLLIAAYCAACRLWRPVLACAPLLAVTLGPAVWAYMPKDPPPIHGQGFTVMSCNLLVGSGSAERAVTYIRAERPDVVFFQEYDPRAHAVLEPALRDLYPHVVTGSREDAFGQAVYLKMAPREVALFPPPSAAVSTAGRRITSVTEPQIRCVVDVDGRGVVLQNVHDAPPAGVSLLQEQLRYFEWLRAFTESERRPIVIAGDFNTTLASTPVRGLLRAGFRSTHSLAGRGRGSTWVDVTWLRRLPGVRIDHILVSRGLTCERSAVGPAIGSDHRPIVARIGFAD